MLSVHFAEGPEMMRHLTEFYLPGGGLLVDVSYGKGRLVSMMPANCCVVGIDIDPKSRAQIVASSWAPPFRDATFHGAIFDPPFLFGRSSKTLLGEGGDDWAVQTGRSYNQTPQDFRWHVSLTMSEVARVCAPAAECSPRSRTRGTRAHGRTPTVGSWMRWWRGFENAEVVD